MYIHTRNTCVSKSYDLISQINVAMSQYLRSTPEFQTADCLVIASRLHFHVTPPLHSVVSDVITTSPHDYRPEMTADVSRT